MCFKYMQQSSFKLKLENVYLSKDSVEDGEFDNWKFNFALSQYFNYYMLAKFVRRIMELERYQLFGDNNWEKNK